MKNQFLALLTFAFIASAALTVSAQEYDQRLTAKFSKKELKDMAAANDPSLAASTFYLNNGYQIADVPKGKEDGVSASIELKSLDAKDINLYALKLEQHEFARQYYLIKGHPGKMLIHLPKNEVEAAFKKSTK
jgi:hypothetical protein